MNKNETLTLWLSIGAALFAVVLIYSYTQEKSMEISKTFGVQTAVVVAKENIHEMQTVQEDMVELQQVPEKFIQPGFAGQMEEVVGLVALAPIRKGEQILKNKVIKPGVETGLSLQVSPGKRALTLPVDEVRGVARLLKPGDRIDIIASLSVGKGGASQEKYIKTLLQDVVILATGPQIVHELPRLHEEVGGEDYIINTRRKNNFNSVTVEVSPREAQNLIYIVDTDPKALFFSLRHPSDNGLNTLHHVNLKNVLGAQTVVPRKPAGQ